jgi:hypothetical protein
VLGFQFVVDSIDCCHATIVKRPAGPFPVSDLYPMQFTICTSQFR